MSSKSDIRESVPKLRFPEFRDFPKWEQVPLRSIIEMRAGKFVSPSDIHENPGPGSYPCYGGNGLRGYTRTSTHTGKYPLIGRQGALCGNVILATGSFHATEHAVVASPRTNVNTDWLFYLLTRLNLNRYATGQAQPGLSVEALEKILVSLPLEEEQRRVGNCLGSVDAIIGAQVRKLEGLRAHKKALMQRLFPAEGETIPRLRFPEFRDAPPWEFKRIDQMGQVITGNTPSTSDPENFGGRWQFVSPGDMTNERYVKTTRITLSDQGLTKARLVRANSVLFVCIGSTIGKVAQAAVDCVTNQQINAVVPFKDHSAEFVFSVLANQSDAIASLAGRHAVPIINKTTFASVMIRQPKFAEQKKIADVLVSLDNLITAHSQKIQLLKVFRTGLMQGLFPSPEEGTDD